MREKMLIRISLPLSKAKWAEARGRGAGPNVGFPTILGVMCNILNISLLLPWKLHTAFAF